MPEVRLVNLTKRYGEIAAVQEASLSITDGEYVSIIGPSGCGKTTLLRCIAGIIEPTEGEIYIDGELVNTLPPESRKTGYVFQELNLFPHMDVLENVTYGLTVKGRPPAISRTIAREALDMVKLPVEESSYPNELSGGARQKAAVARAIVSESRLLLLDEPLGALDVRARTDLRKELRRLVKDLGLTAIHVTHDQEEAMSISDRIVLMRAGRIVETGTPSDLYSSPKEIFTANFLGETNFLEGRVVDATSEGSVVDANGLRLTTAASSYVGRQVVVAIKPEFVEIGSGTKDRQNTWSGRVVARVFLGSTFRYEILLENSIRISARCLLSDPASGLRMGKTVNLHLPSERAILFTYPEEGLEEARKLD